MFHQSGLQQAYLLPAITHSLTEVTFIMCYLSHIDMFNRFSGIPEKFSGRALLPIRLNFG
jgi:hypothetical protein